MIEMYKKWKKKKGKRKNEVDKDCSAYIGLWTICVNVSVVTISDR